MILGRPNSSGGTAINFIPNDPLTVKIVPMRKVAAKPDRAAGTAGVKVASNTPQGLYQLGDPDFVPWQARQAAILAIEAWEAVLDTPLISWAQESANPASLALIPDAGQKINAFYDRESLSFFHQASGRRTTFSGASTDCAAHETGHAILDARRPDLWSVNMLEVAGFHEAFGDVTSIVTALADRPTREALLKISPKLDKPNFVEAVVGSLVAHDQLAFDIKAAQRGAVADVPDSGPVATHAVQRRGRKQQLQRVAFACGAPAGACGRSDR